MDNKKQKERAQSVTDQDKKNYEIKKKVSSIGNTKKN